MPCESKRKLAGGDHRGRQDRMAGRAARGRRRLRQVARRRSRRTSAAALQSKFRATPSSAASNASKFTTAISLNLQKQGGSVSLEIIEGGPGGPPRGRGR